MYIQFMHICLCLLCLHDDGIGFDFTSLIIGSLIYWENRCKL
ncbi:hypothetical protein GLYMA_01G007650v4 [Glycine max]|nr:hypothetical protein GLYMA_01G007650v4 [Glycine max]KAH1161012.1 hypothetical protein GYH30_000078 [Glycine max]